MTPIQFDAILQAINHAKAGIEEDTFIDPYGENPDGYNNETLLKALEEVEQKIVSDNHSKNEMSLLQ